MIRADEMGPVVDAMVKQQNAAGAQRAPQGAVELHRPLSDRDRLLWAGRQLFAAYGYAHTGVADLCAEAKLPLHAFEQEFTSREELLIALYDEVATYGLRAAENTLMAEGMDDCPTETRVRLIFSAYVRAVTEDPCAARVAFVEALGVSRRVDEHLAMWRSMWLDFLTQEAERAVFRGDAPAQDHTVTVSVVNHALFELLAHHARRPRQVTAEWITEELTRLGLSMIVSS